MSTANEILPASGLAPISNTDLYELALRGWTTLEKEDPGLFEFILREYRRQSQVLSMIAAASMTAPCALVCQSSVLENVTTEGYPGARYHGGCEIVDEIERLAIERAKSAFGARYANVQPHSGTSANEIVIFGLLKPGDTILGLALDAGGHLTHGAQASVVGQYFRAFSYGVDHEGLLDYDEIERLAKTHRPKLIISGASAYPRRIDFRRFREIADEVGAILMADISHVAGLVVAGLHPSPIDHAHITTTSTYKQLCGPRGGLILSGKDSEYPVAGSPKTLAQHLQEAAFPYFQGTPILSAIAAKARALAIVQKPTFHRLAERVVADARALAESFADLGYRVLSGGTDNHMVLIDVGSSGLTGLGSERALERCSIVVNRNRIPGDTRPPRVASGLRLGTNILALRRMRPREMPQCAELVDRVLRQIDGEDLNPTLGGSVECDVTKTVQSLCHRFPLEGYFDPQCSNPKQEMCESW